MYDGPPNKGGINFLKLLPKKELFHPPPYQQHNIASAKPIGLASKDQTLPYPILPGKKNLQQKTITFLFFLKKGDS